MQKWTNKGEAKSKCTRIKQDGRREQVFGANLLLLHGDIIKWVKNQCSQTFWDLALKVDTKLIKFIKVQLKFDYTDLEKTINTRGGRKSHIR